NDNGRSGNCQHFCIAYWTRRITITMPISTKGRDLDIVCARPTIGKTIRTRGISMHDLCNPPGRIKTTKYGPDLAAIVVVTPTANQNDVAFDHLHDWPQLPRVDVFGFQFC